MRHPWRVVITLGGLLLALNLLLVVGLSTDTEPATGGQPPAVERTIPTAGSIIRQLEDVGVDLRDDLTGVLLIDGVEIPEDQLQRVESLGQLRFRPGEGKDIERFSPGAHAATVLYWPQTASRDEGTSAYTWSFRAA
ncbi:MAG: hypothetical protein M5U14_13445 [Acidimicrobiia bacterium]|nr:hypothetical protein [Acidimicrobiia bacterium]